MDLGIAGRTALVTGASRGIGLEAAKLLAADGANLVLVARTPGKLDEAGDACRALAPGDAQIRTLPLDVTEAGAAAQCEALGAELGGVDILVNNAGQAVWRDLDEIPETDWQAAIDLNVTAPRHLIQRLAPAMAEGGWGRIVNVSSTAGKRPSPQIAEYSVAKAAMLSLSRVFADRYAGTGVLVNAICPGPTASEMWMDPGGLLDQSAAMGGKDTREEALDAAGAGRPIGRLAEPAEIGAVIAFLCSYQASYVAGSAWSVDGGTVQVII